MLLKGLGVVLLLAFAVAAATGTAGHAAGYNGGGNNPHKPTLTLSVTKQKLAKARRKGLKVKATCNTACKAAVGAYKKGKLLGRGSKRLARGTGTVKVRFNKAGKRRLKRARSIKLTLRGRATSAGGTSDVVKATTTLRRG